MFTKKKLDKPRSFPQSSAGNSLPLEIRAGFMGEKTNKMEFTEILNSKYYYLVEAIEHGSSDKEMIQNYKNELYAKTGYKWID